mmetsp:Transcript_9353/g.24744  ORF Transcript_9353/g.24744 Transcript_9353/m.24744 type:complete len:189 (+) Transcript_9353:183-749(+)
MEIGNAAFCRFLASHEVLVTEGNSGYEVVRLSPLGEQAGSPLRSAKDLWSEVKASSSEDAEKSAREEVGSDGRDGRGYAGDASEKRLESEEFAEDRTEYVKLPSQAELMIREQRGSLTCKACDKSFQRRSNLNKHIRHVHARERLYVCKSCGNRFGQKSSIDKHLRVIHGAGAQPTISKSSARQSGRC